jgi:putative ABC transport system ATP-binding protein
MQALMLYIAGIEKRFGGRTVLSAVTMRVEPGEYVAIVGESGVGKSTLLNIIAGLEPPDAGEVRFEDRNLLSMDDDARTLLRRDKFGFVFQAFHVLPHLTVEQNVGLPLLLRSFSPGRMKESSFKILNSVGLGGRENSMPKELSGGELQRVAIARALVGDPRLVLADEPTGNLDQENARQVLALLREQVKAHGAAGILVTHSEAAAASCDRRYRLTVSGLEEL